MFSGAFSELRSVEFAQTFLPSALRLCSSVMKDSSASGKLSPKILVQGYVFQDWHETREEQTTRGNIREFPWNNPFHGEGFEQL